MTMTTSVLDLELPRYRSRKEVRALKIASIDEFTLRFSDPGYGPITVEPKVFTRYTPVVGDYYVVYEDGYVSISPRKAFEEGYTRI